MSIDTWHHVDVVRSGEFWTCYLDDIETTSTSVQRTGLVTINTLLSTTGTGANFKGKSANIGFSRVAATALQIASINSNPEDFESILGSTLFFYDMQQLGDSSAIDRTSNLNNAVLTDFTIGNAWVDR